MNGDGAGAPFLGEADINGWREKSSFGSIKKKVPHSRPSDDIGNVIPAIRKRQFGGLGQADKHM